MTHRLRYNCLHCCIFTYQHLVHMPLQPGLRAQEALLFRKYNRRLISLGLTDLSSEQCCVKETLDYSELLICSGLLEATRNAGNGSRREFRISGRQ